MDSIIILPPSPEPLIPAIDDLPIGTRLGVRMNQSAGTVIITHLNPLPWLIFADVPDGLMKHSIAGAHSVFEMSLVFVFLFCLGVIFHYAMTVGAPLLILLTFVCLADNIRHVFG